MVCKRERERERERKKKKMIETESICVGRERDGKKE